MVMKNVMIVMEESLLSYRHAILTGAAVVHKGVQERISGGYKFKVSCQQAAAIAPKFCILLIMTWHVTTKYFSLNNSTNFLC